MTKRKILSVLATGLLTLPLVAANCTPSGGGDCTSGTDCSDTQICHPTLMVCVDNCVKVDGACDSADETICSEADIDGLYFKNVCVCDPANDTCPDGTKCNPYDRACDTPCTGDTDCADYPSDQNRTCQDSGGTMFCLLPADDCRPTPTACASGTVCDTTTGSATIGQCIAECTATSCTGSQVCNTSTHLCQDPCTAGSCGTDQYCDDARFGGTNLCLANPTSCSNDTCLEDSMLCDVSTGETANLCVDPDDATNTCSAPGAMASGGPIIYVDVPADDITESATEPVTAGTCIPGGDTLMSVFFSTDGGISTSAYSNTFYLNTSNAWAPTYYVVRTESSGLVFLDVYLCFENAGTVTRAFYHNGTGGESNRACVEIDVP